MAEEMNPDRLTMLGRDHQVYGDAVVARLADGRTACAMSVGADENSPSLLAKKYPDQKNEDALFAYDRGDRVVLAVADAHFGPESSHRLVEELDRLLDEIPEDAVALDRLLTRMQPSPRNPDSESTFLVAVYDRRQREGFGLCVGDCALFVVADDGARMINRLESRFVATDVEDYWANAEPDRFFFFAEPGALLVACSDGVHECCYRNPRDSIRPKHLLELLERAGAEPEPFARRLCKLALQGIDGHPGGQDNIAIVVSATSSAEH